MQTLNFMDSKPTKNIKPYLQLDETLIWAGQPKKGITFEPSDIFKTLFVIMLTFFTYFATNALAKISLLFAIPVGTIFYSVCILLGIGRFFIDSELRKKTFYGLTNKRIIIKAGGLNTKIRSVYLDTKPKIDFLPNLDDTSTIYLGIKEPSTSKGGFTWIPNIKGYTSLYRLSEGNFVHKKLREVLNNA
jgi:hypothetical protein